MDAVKVHYERDSLVEDIKKALGQSGLGEAQLTIEEVAPIDHFHVRGIDATKDLSEILHATSASKILDIGSGLGGPARYFAKNFGAQVTGIDLTQSYVDAANYLTQRTGLSELVQFDCGDALSLPYADGSFDIAMTQHVAMNIQNRERFYSEAYRVLKSDGRFALYDVIAGDEDEVYFPVPWADTPATSFLLKEDALRNVLTDRKFKILSWTDRTAKAIEWVTEVSKKQTQSNPGTSPLGLNVILGTDFGHRASNLAKSLREGRAKILEVVASK
jgi:ubiquinone/menaquinone biosynthesis C-methylase UbiE